MFFWKAYAKNVNIILKIEKRNARNVSYVMGRVKNAKQNNVAKCGYWNVTWLCNAKQKSTQIYHVIRTHDKSTKIVTDTVYF